MTETNKIQVYCRIRPSSENEDFSSSPSSIENNNSVYRLDSNNTRLSINDINNNNFTHTFQFDSILSPSSNNSSYYSSCIEGLINNKYLNGINTTIIGYGSTGSGKQHTFFGDNNNNNKINKSIDNNNEKGILFSSIDTIFDKIEQKTMNTKTLLLFSCFVLNNNNSIIDLLTPNTKQLLSIESNNTHYNRSLGLTIENLSKIEIKTKEEAKQLLLQTINIKNELDLRFINTNIGGGNKSHLFFDFQLESCEKANPNIFTVSLLRFCLLAGSGGVNLKFNTGLQSINKIVDLLANQQLVYSNQYQSHPLTQLLEMGIGGINSVTAILLFINPPSSSSLSSSSSSSSSSSVLLSDSLHTLQFGSKCNRIKTESKINRFPYLQSIREIREEIKKIRGKLELNNISELIHDIQQKDIEKLKLLNKQLENQKKQGWEKKREESRKIIEKRKEILKEEGLLRIIENNNNKEGGEGNEEEKEIPFSLLNQSKNLLNTIVSGKLAIEETEKELKEKRIFYKELIEKEENNNQNQQNKEEEKEELNKEINELIERERNQRIEVDLIVEDYKKILIKIQTIQAKTRKSLLFNNNQNQNQEYNNINKSDTFEEMKKTIENDVDYLNQINQLNENTIKATQIINSRFSSTENEELREETIKLLNDLNQQSQYNKQLEYERDLLWAKLIEGQIKNQLSFQQFQSHLFTIFQQYRNHFENKKIEMEKKYKEIIENSVRDALKLNEENQKLKLLLENKNKLI